MISDRSIPLVRLLGFSLLFIVLSACSRPLTGDFSTLNSRLSDHQAAISGDGRLAAFVSNRSGRELLVLYNLEQQTFIPLPDINRGNGVIETPSLSRTGRYIVYLSSRRGRPEIELYDRLSRKIDVLTIGYQGWVKNPSISPDGRYVVFESGRNGQWDIEILDRGQGIELDVTPGSTVSPPNIR